VLGSKENNKKYSKVFKVEAFVILLLSVASLWGWGQELVLVLEQKYSVIKAVS
jgi:hypothetical protein